MTNSIHTLSNLKKFVKEADNHFSPSKHLDGNEFSYQVIQNGRPYFVTVEIDHSDSSVSMSVFPQIVCTPHSINAVAQYITLINIYPKHSTIRLSNNKEIFTKVIRSFKNGPMTIEMFENMERKCMLAITPFVNAIQKVANGVLPSVEDMDPKNLITAYLKESIPLDIDKFIENMLASDNDDDEDEGEDDKTEDAKRGSANNDDDEDDNKTASSATDNKGPTIIPSFEELWKSHMNEIDTESKTKSSLFDELSALSTDINPLVIDTSDDDE